MHSKNRLLLAGMVIGCAVCASTTHAFGWKSPDANAPDHVTTNAALRVEALAYSIERVGNNRAVKSTNREKFVATPVDQPTKQMTQQGVRAVTFEAAS